MLTSSNPTTVEMAASRRESRKRRRLSERRRILGRLGGGQQEPGDEHQRAHSPQHLFDHQRGISMKIQLHVTVAPDGEPLILDQQQQQPQRLERTLSNESTGSSIGEQIHERLMSRQNSASGRRHQLIDMHKNNVSEPPRHSIAAGLATPPTPLLPHSDDNLAARHAHHQHPNHAHNHRLPPVERREPGARSSTITGGMEDEATLRFLARQQQRALAPASLSTSLISSGSLGGLAAGNKQDEREHIYFKRDGQRFGHEFTLKLAVERTYRCLLKLRPLIPVQTITVQGQHVSFVDCSLGGPQVALSLSAPPSTLTLNRNDSLQLLNGRHHHQQRPSISSQRDYSPHSHRAMSMMGADLCAGGQEPAERSGSLSLEPAAAARLSQSKQLLLQQQLIKQQQHRQMLKQFSTANKSSASSSVAGAQGPVALSSLTSAHSANQLIYMFDWSAERFDVNKNKDRTQIQAVLKFRNGQILSLPIQVKFYQPERRQHLNWGNRLHFIDYDCQINTMGQIDVERIQYY